jgi:hypothetical protein
MFRIQSWKLCYIAKYHQLLHFIALDLRKQTTIGLIDRIVIDISQLRCPELADISLPAISCKFACHKSKYVCALRTAYSLAHFLKYYILILQYAKCPAQSAFH